MDWTKRVDAKTNAVVYAPGAEDEVKGLPRAAFDPNAPEAKVIAELACVVREGEIEADFDAGWGVK